MLLAIQTPHGSLLNIYSTKDSEYAHKEDSCGKVHYHLVVDAGKTIEAANEPITVYQIETKKVFQENKRCVNYEQPAYTPFLKEHARERAAEVANNQPNLEVPLQNRYHQYNMSFPSFQQSHLS